MHCDKCRMSANREKTLFGSWSDVATDLNLNRQDKVLLNMEAKTEGICCASTKSVALSGSSPT